MHLYSIFWQDKITNIKIKSFQIFWRLCYPFWFTIWTRKKWYMMRSIFFNSSCMGWRWYIDDWKRLNRMGMWSKIWFRNWKIYAISRDLKIPDFPSFVLFGCKINDCSQTTNPHQHSFLVQYVWTLRSLTLHNWLAPVYSLFVILL